MLPLPPAKTIFSMLALLLIAACSAPTPLPTQPVIPTEAKVETFTIGQLFSLEMGEERISSDGKLHIKFSTLLSETRCPAQIECAESGQAEILLSVQRENGEWEGLTLSTLYPLMPTFSGGYEFQLQALEPHPQVLDEEIPLKEYKATLMIAPIESAAQAQLGRPFQLKGGEQAVFADQALRIKLASVVEDTRCPRSVMCVWSKPAVVRLEVQLGNSEMMQIDLPDADYRPSATVSGYHIELKLVEPYPETPEDEIAFEEYTITLVVKQQ